MIGANLVGNRLQQYRALLVANLLLDSRLDADEWGGDGTGGSHVSSPTASNGSGGATSGAGALPGQSRYGEAPSGFGGGRGAAGHVGGAGAGGRPQTHVHGSSQLMVDFNGLLGVAEDPSVSAAQAARAPYWGHLARTGVVLDFGRGNVLWLDPEGSVTHAVHGKRVLSQRQIVRIYGPGRGPIPVPGVPIPLPTGAGTGAHSTPPPAPGAGASTSATAGTPASPAAAAVEPVEDASVLDARARLHSVIASSMPIGPFTQHHGASGAPAPPAFGTVHSGFDEPMPALFALLVSRYDAWLRSDPSRRRGDEEGIMSALEAEQAQFNAGLAAARAAAEGGPLPTVEEADEEDGGDESLGRQSRASARRSPRPQLRKPPRSRSGDADSRSSEADFSLAAASASPTAAGDGARGSGGDDAGSQQSRSLEHAHSSISAGAAAPLGAEEDSGDEEEDEPEEEGDEYDAYLRASIARFGAPPQAKAGGAAGSLPSAGGKQLQPQSQARAQGSSPVDYSFLAECAQAAHRFIYSAYCNYGFHALWRDLDSFVEKRPATKAMLQSLRKMPLPLLPAPRPGTDAGLTEEGAAESAAVGACDKPPAPLSGPAVATLTGRSRRLRTFILTNASWDHMAPALRHALGPDWLDLFDAVFVEGRKRTLFAAPQQQRAAEAARAIPAVASASGYGGFGGDEDEGPTSGGGGAGARPGVGAYGRTRAAAAPPSASQLRPFDVKTGRPMQPAVPGGRLMLKQSPEGGHVADLSLTKVWAGGSLADISATLSEYAPAGAQLPAPAATSGATAPPPSSSSPRSAIRVCYMGDHVQQDIAGPASSAGWTTVAIVPGLASLAEVCASALDAGASAAPVNPRLLGEPASAASGAGEPGVYSPRSAPVGSSSVVSAAEYHLRTLGSGRGWAVPSLHASIVRNHASLAVPSVEWLARALAPRMASSLALAEKAGAARVPAVGPRGSGGMSIAAHAAQGPATPAAASRALVRAALSLSVSRDDVLTMHRVPPAAAVLRSCAVSAGALPASSTATDVNGILRAVLDLPPAAGPVTDAAAKLTAQASPIGAGLESSAVDEVPSGGCGCFGGSGATKRSRAPNDAGGAASDASPAQVAEELATWLRQAESCARVKR